MNGNKRPLLTIIVPIFNEEKTLLNIVEKLVNLVCEKEIILVNDGSTDGTSKIIGSINNPLIRVFSHEQNCGKGSSVRTGIKHSRGEIISIQDADLEYSPEELLNLVEIVQSGKYEIVFGSRFMKNNPVMYRSNYIGNKLMSLFISMIASKRISDTYTCYKVFSKHILDKFNLHSKGFEIEAELSVLSALSGAKFKEFPISYNPRKKNEGKKICWKDMLKGILASIKARFSTR